MSLEFEPLLPCKEIKPVLSLILKYIISVPLKLGRFKN